MTLKFNTYELPGIDVSHNNGKIDWSKVIAKGTVFAGIRVGYGRVIDSKFKDNWSAAKNKVCRIPYWYLDYYSNHNEGSPVNGMSDEAWGKEQARNCWRFFDGDFEGIVALDVEDGNKNYAPPVHTVLPRVRVMIKAFFAEIDRLSGKTNGLYLSLGYLQYFVADFGDRPLWVAWYTRAKTIIEVQAAVKATGWRGPLLIWQWASDGDADGNSTSDGLAFGMEYGFLDLNFWVGDKAKSIEILGGLPGGTSQTETPEPETLEPQPEDGSTRYRVTALISLTIRKAPSASAGQVGYLLRGAEVEIEQLTDGWGKIKGQDWWIKVKGYTETIYKEVKMIDKFGTVKKDGKEIRLTGDATPSNRVFFGWWGDASEGESYTDEWVADGIDENGNDVQVYWQFDQIKGEEPEDASNLPFDDEHVSEIREN